MEEVEKNKHFGLLISRQANGFNHVKHLLGKLIVYRLWCGGQSSGRGRRYYGRVGRVAGGSKAGGGIWQ